MLNYTEALIARGAIKLPSYKKAKFEGVRRAPDIIFELAAERATARAVRTTLEDNRVLEELRELVENCVEHAVEGELERNLPRAIESAVEDVLRDVNYEDRIDDLEREVSKIEDLSDGLDDLTATVSKLDDQVDHAHSDHKTTAALLKETVANLALVTSHVAKLDAAVNKPKGWLARLLGL